MCCSKFALDLEVDLEKDPGTFGGAAESRKCTDILGLVVMVLYLGTVIGLTVYCSSNSDVDIYLNGYDDCGNICNKNNKETDSLPYECFGKNMEGKGTKISYDSINGTRRECTKECSKQYCAHGVATDSIPIYPFILIYKDSILIYMALGLGFSIITYFVLNWSGVKLVVILFSILCTALITVLFYLKLFFDKETQNVYFAFYIIVITGAIIGTMVLIYIFPFLLTKRASSKIALTQELHNEVQTALSELNFCLSYVLPSLSIITITLLLYLLHYSVLYVSAFSYLEKVDEDIIKGQPILDYVPYQTGNITKWLLIFAGLLLYEFVKNFQCMVVGGSVAQWYFTRRDGGLTKPIRTTMKNIFRYHFGTLCWSAFILSITFPIQIVVNILSITINELTYRETMNSCLRRMLSENNFRICLTRCGFLTRNGLIMTAIHGCNFSAGTIRAGKLLSQNMFNASSIIAYGDWIMIFFKLVVCYALCQIHLYLFLIKPGVSLCFMLIGCQIWSCIVADCFHSVLTVTQKTLLLCFCEDCLYNYGTAKPYHMSPEFAKNIENVNIFVDAKYWEIASDKWNQGPRRLYM